MPGTPPEIRRSPVRLPCWTFWIDTGGTFTDCIAFSPGGQPFRAKVLSSGVLQATVAGSKENVVGIEANWSWPFNLLKGYTVDTGTARVQILEADSTGTLTLDNAVAWPPGTQLTISSGEEAPILIARLITQTPLRSALPEIRMRLGTTRATNALLERTGGKVAFITTEGLEDVVEIGTQQRPELFALEIRKAPQLYAATFGIRERLASDGAVLTPLDIAEIERITEMIADGDFDAVAISLLNAYANPAHEQALAQALGRSPGMSTSSGVALFPGIHLLPRSQTAIVNAYLQPVLEAFLGGIRTHLPRGSLHLISSAGTAVNSNLFHPKDALLSGPAGGVVAAQDLGKKAGTERLITFDMGGTSTDCARIEGGLETTDTLEIGGISIATAAVAIETVAAGGGSICNVHLGKLSVGPESAGASPGPACYGNGGPLTITDVNLLAGKLDPASFEIPIFPDKAREALENAHEQLARDGAAMTDRDLIAGFLRIANETMAAAIRRISVRKGYDPSDYTLLSYGGAGGLHACGVAAILDMTTIIFPYDAGLFSAFGAGMARMSRLAHREILAPLTTAGPGIAAMLDDLEKEARAALAEEGVGAADAVEVGRTVFLRVSGQHYAIPVTWDGSDARETFVAAYQSIFGYVEEDAHLEVIRAQVRVSTLSGSGEVSLPAPGTSQEQRHLKSSDGRSVPVYDWSQLREDITVHGPALVVNPYATYAVDAGWTLELATPDMAICRFSPGTSRPGLVTGRRALDLEIFTKRFSGIAEEMGAQLQRTAQSVNVRQRLDFSCALLDPRGQLLVNAAHIPVHLGSLGIFTREILKRMPLGPGDVVISNHPAFGGSHLPDVSLVAGVFDDQEKLLGYVANRAHHAEIGGSKPGSMPVDATSLEEEGVVIAPLYLLKNGEPQWSALTDVLTAPPYPTRALAENLADIRAALAALQRGIGGLRELARTSGAEAVISYMQEIHDYSHRVALHAISKLPPGVHRATEHLDDGTRIQVKVTVDGDALDVDFTGTRESHPGNLNATDAIVHSAVLYVVRLLVTEDIPLNEGVSRCIRLTLPRCFLNPAFPENPAEAPAVVGGNTESSQRLVDTLIKALRLSSCGQGTMNNLVFGNEHFGYYETICGGAGAGDGYHGASAVHQHMTNTRITDPEELEYRYPVRLRRFLVRKGSGGKGQYRGGDGVIREIEFLEAVELSFLSQHRKELPFGLAGGEPGAMGNQYILRSDGTKEQLAGIDSAKLSPGDRIVVETPGGGGFGRP